MQEERVNELKRPGRRDDGDPIGGDRRNADN
jgi:hypothetical protein